MAEGVRSGLEMPKYAHGSVTFSTEHGEYTFELQELGSWSSERMYADEQERQIRRGTPAWQLAGYQEFTGNGKLRLRQGSPPSGYGSPTFGDRKIVRLEDRLTEVFVRFEVWRMERTHQVEQRGLPRSARAGVGAAMAKARVLTTLRMQSGSTSLPSPSVPGWF